MSRLYLVLIPFLTVIMSCTGERTPSGAVPGVPSGASDDAPQGAGEGAPADDNGDGAAPDGGGGDPDGVGEAAPDPTDGGGDPTDGGGDPTDGGGDPTEGGGDGSRRLTVVGDRVLFDGRPVALRGIGLTCTEYMFKGNNGGELNLAGNCFAAEDCSLDQAKLEPVMALLTLPDEHDGSGQAPVTRVPLTAEYYSGDDEARTECYRRFVGELVDYLTERDLPVILDLHWNNDGLGQQNSVTGWPGGVVGESNGDMATVEYSRDFWEQVSEEYGGNELVLFELYNEPMGNGERALPSEIWLNGGRWDGRSVGAAAGVEFLGMRQMYEIVRARAPESIVIVGGNNWAFNADDCIAFHDAVRPTQVMYAFHPYQGLGQGEEKTIAGLSRALETMGSRAPIVITEFGQYCCSEEPPRPGPYVAPVQSDEVYACGPFVEDLLELAASQDSPIGWVAWGWNPNHYDDPDEGVAGNAAGCLGPDVNFGKNLWGINGTTEQHYVNFGEGDLRIGGGASWHRIWPAATGWDAGANPLPEAPQRDMEAGIDKQCAASFSVQGGSSEMQTRQYAACQGDMVCAMADQDWGQCVDCANLEFAAPFWPDSLVSDACDRCGLDAGVCTPGGRPDGPADGPADGGDCSPRCAGEELCVGDDNWRQCVDCAGIQWACGYWSEPLLSQGRQACAYDGPCLCNGGDDGCVES